MKAFLLKLSIVFLPLLICFYSISQPGTLDSSFGVNGKASFSFATISAANYCEPVALQQDGKIVVAASYFYGTGQSDFIISRYKTNGTLDSSFGTNGYVITIFDSSISQNAWGGFIATAVLVQPDGKILAGGYGYVPFSGPQYFCLARYQTNGKPDTSFGVFGSSMNTLTFPPRENELYSLALQQDGKIVAGGWSDGYCVVRYKSNGFLDSTFAVNGILSNQNIPSWGPTAVSIQEDGKILTGAQSTHIWENDTMLFEVDRLMPNGSYDSTFGMNGHVFTSFNSNANYLFSVQSLKDGKLLALGSSAGNVAIAKYKSNGLPDSSFGSNGKLVSQFGVAAISTRKVLITYDNKIIVIAQTSGNNVAVIRLLSNGTVDSTFGVSGKCVFNFGAGTFAYSGALQPDGKIITVGNPNISIARIKGTEPVSVSIKKSISVAEGNTGTTPVQFKIVLNKPSPTDVFVNYSTKNISALAGSDYISTSGTVRIKAGKAAGNIVVPVIGDNTREANERFALVLNNPVNAILGSFDSATCTIKNDDPSFALNISSQENKTANNSTIQIYPNPIKDVLNIQGLNINIKTNISIIDGNGHVLANQTINNTFYSWNIHALPAGTYFLRIEAGKNSRSMKFIKQ